MFRGLSPKSMTPLQLGLEAVKGIKTTDAEPRYGIKIRPGPPLALLGRESGLEPQVSDGVHYCPVIISVRIGKEIDAPPRPVPKFLMRSFDV